MSQRKYKRPPQFRSRKRRTRLDLRSCLAAASLLFIILITAALIMSAYLFFPKRTNILLLGLDYTEPTNAVGRTDTIIMSTFLLPDGYVGLLSIPRDLWVSIPGVGENRINTAHFFAEAQQTGFGPVLAMDTIEENFAVDMDYFARIQFQGFRDVVNAMGGLDIYLPEPMAGYQEGAHHLTGNKTLAFVRNRQGSDDFFRMARAQLVLKAITEQLSKPANWIKIPAVIRAFSASIDTDVPAWEWPRLVFALLYGGIDDLDNKTISREMTTSYVTDSGANVLLPDWNMIFPLKQEIFGE